MLSNPKSRSSLIIVICDGLLNSLRQKQNLRLRAMPTCLAIVALLWSVHAVSAQQGRQALTTSILRVCADPSNLPFSNDKLEGFENQIIKVLGEHMDLEVRYTWFPQTIGFVRNTLRLRECDLISGITTTSELVQNTNPYYHSTYVMLYQEGSGLTATSIRDPQLKDKKLGVIAGTPPANFIAQQGMLTQVVPYHLMADTRRNVPARDAVLDVGTGKTDVAFVWGPIAAYYARESENPLTLVPLINEDSKTRLNFTVSMAVRYNETDWKHAINDALDAIQPQIDEILRSYGVPLLNERGELLSE